MLSLEINANRLGFAVQLCLLRFPGQGLPTNGIVPNDLLYWIGRQLNIAISYWTSYANRKETPREHFLELRIYLGIKPFSLADYKKVIHATTELAFQTSKGIVLAINIVDVLRKQHLMIPSIDIIERICAEAITRADRLTYAKLKHPLSITNKKRLDALLKRSDNRSITWLAWLRQTPGKPNSKHMLEHIERLQTWYALNLPAGIQ